VAGSLALVGSGEYLPEMLDLERELLDDGVSQGKLPKFVQIPTAAGQEGEHRLEYWKNLGAKQADRLGVEQVFLPVFTRDDADNPQIVERVQESALVYLSGGNPAYLAESLRDTLLAKALYDTWQTGTSIAGCSAGAMALCEYIVSLRLVSEGVRGLGFVSNLKVLPHYDRYFRWVPELAIKKLIKESKDAALIGIDELTSLIKRDDAAWQVKGQSLVHVLSRNPSTQHSHKEFITFESSAE